MKAIIIIIYFCVTLLPSIIHGGSSCNNSTDNFTRDVLNKVKAKVDEILKNGGYINRIFKPLRFLGRGAYSNTYEGVLIRDNNNNRTVAMKFSPMALTEGEECEIEYDMYAYMHAVNNSMVEKYGIPAVYHYGMWEECVLLAITLLDSKLSQISRATQSRMSDLDIFIIFREYVRITKYIHRHGICHDDITLDNIMFRKNQGFIIDFNMADKVLESTRQRDCRTRDWELFLLSMFELCRIEVDLYKPIDTVVGKMHIKVVDHASIKKYIADIKHTGLERVFSKFAEYVFRDSLNYNRMHQIITEEICGLQEPPLVSWLTDQQREEATNELLTNEIPDIQSIDNPSLEIDYPTPNYTYFANN